MDWKPRVIRSQPGNALLPFFMTYPGYPGAEQEKTLLRDLEYLQQNFPNEVKGYQRKIAEVLDRMDYEGSMIYDEYPDRYSLQRLAGTVVQMLKREDQERPAAERISEEKWSWLENMMLVLLCHEIYKRRHGGPRGMMYFG